MMRKRAYLAFLFCALGYMLSQSTLITDKTEETSKNILIATLPKSGSTYLSASLKVNFGYTTLVLPEDWRHGIPAPAPVYAESGDIVPLKGVTGIFKDFFQKKRLLLEGHYRVPGTIPDKHFGGSPLLDVGAIKQHMNKMIVHIRDPRQVLLSFVHHLNQYEGRGFDLPDRSLRYYELPGYHDLDLKTQIDLGIENVLPDILIWINGWLDLKEKEEHLQNGLKILITTYDEIVQDEIKLFAKIAVFYDIPFNPGDFKAIAKNANVRFRKGDPEEWRFVLTDAQKKRVAEIVPAHLLERFNWKE